MAEAPKPQRRRRIRRLNNSIVSAAPTADATPSGTITTPRRRTRRRGSRRSRVVVARPISNNGNEIIETNFIARPNMRRSRLTRAIKREIKREGLDGPKVSVQQKITSTFGMIGPNTTGNAEMELNFFLHPALAKEANDGTAFGPLQALAAQYSLWRIKYLTLRFTPMVGSSAVSGTVVRASLNLSQSPGGSNWSGLGTRLHHDMHPGQVATFHLRGDQVGGPRDGGWWFTDTNEEGSQSAGPIVEVHTLGKTLSTFRDQPWDGPLFLVEGIGLWQFANYQVKPALGSLERREAVTKADLDATSGQPITMELPVSSDVAVFMDSLEPKSVSPAAVPANGTPSVGETIFQIVDVGAQLAQGVVPPPFGWLIKGGWWFVKKLLGRTRADKAQFLVYASLQDAQNNKPAIANATVNIPEVTTKLLVTQINSPNVGPNPGVMGSTRGGAQNLLPDQLFRLHSSMISELFVKLPPPAGAQTTDPVAVPVSALPGVLRANSGTVVNPAPSGGAGFIQTPWWIGAPGRAPGIQGGGTVVETNYVPSSQTGGYIHSLYRLINPIFTDQSGNINYFDPPIEGEGVNFCVLNGFNSTGTVSSSNPYAVYGKVVGTNKIHAGTTPNLDMILTLIKTTTDYRVDNDTVRDLVMVVGDNVGQASFAIAPKPNASSSWNILERDIPEGQYLLGVSYTNAPAIIRGVDIPTTIIPSSYSRVESSISPIFPYNLAGQMFSATSVDVILRYVEYHPPSRELLNQLRDLNVHFYDDPSVLPSLPYEVSGLATSSVEGEDELPPQEFTASDSEGDSVEDFILALGNEMIDLPRRWIEDPDFNKFLEL